MTYHRFSKSFCLILSAIFLIAPFASSHSEPIPCLSRYKVERLIKLNKRHELAEVLFVTGPEGRWSSNLLWQDLGTFPRQLEEALNLNLISFSEISTDLNDGKSLGSALLQWSFGDKAYAEKNPVYQKIVNSVPRFSSYRVSRVPTLNSHGEIVEYLHVSGPEGVWSSAELWQDVGLFPRQLEEALNRGLVSFGEVSEKRNDGHSFIEALLQWSFGDKAFAEKNPVYQKIVSGVGKLSSYKVERFPMVNPRGALYEYLYVSGPAGTWASGELRQNLDIFPTQLEDALNKGSVTLDDLTQNLNDGLSFRDALLQWSAGDKAFAEKNPVYKKIVGASKCSNNLTGK